MNGKKMRAGASLFMSIVLSATLMVPNIAFAQTTTDKGAAATSTAAATSAATVTSSSTGDASADDSATADASITTLTAASSVTAAADDSTAHATGMTVDPAANAKQNAINESYNEAQSASQAQSAGNGTSAAQSASTLPSSYSLRDVNGKVYVDAVRQQGNLNDCWANSTSSCVESNILKQTGGATAPGQTLSARQISWNIYKLVNSETVIAGRAIDADQYGEGMAVPFGQGVSSSLQGAQIVTSWQGLASESGSQAIPFQDSTGNKAALPSDKWAITEAQRDWSIAHVTDVEMLPTPSTLDQDSKGNLTYTYNEAGTTAIKQALMGTGAVQMNYYATLPTDAAFNASTGAQYIDLAHQQSYNEQAHSITVVGWDDNYAASNFTSNPGHNGAFLCKNSWGSYGDTAKIEVTVKNKTETISKRTYTDASGAEYTLYREKDASGKINFYKVVGGIVDMTAPVLSSLSDYNKYDSLNPVYIDANGNIYTIHEEKAAGTGDSPTWQGYFWLSYYDTSILQAASYTVDAPAANASGTYKYTHEYLYDYLGTASLLNTAEGAYDTPASTTGTSAQSAATTVVQAANVFTAKANEALTAVSAVTQTAASTVQLFIYRLINGATSPTQSATGNPELTMTVTETNAGYHTIVLSKPLYLHAGESFSVVERITNTKGQGYLPIELAAAPFGGNTWKAQCGSGESYISTDGGKTWTDVSTLSLDYFPMSKLANGEAYSKQYGVKLDSFGNVEIRALTVDWTPTPEPTPMPTPTKPTAAATTAASYAPVATSATAQPELPKTADNAVDACMLLVLLAAAGMGTAIGARRKVTR